MCGKTRPVHTLYSKEKILQISQNPSILKDIIDAYEFVGNLPMNRSLIFEKAIEARFFREGIKDNYSPKFETSKKKIILQKIAFHMVNLNEGLSMSKQTFMKIISDNRDILLQNEAEEVIEEITYKDGFLKKENDRYSFIKQPYQEFFAAKEIKEIWLNNLNRNKNPLKDHKVKSYFRNRSIYQTVALISGLLNEDEAYILVNSLNAKTKTRRLAAMCIQNSSEIDKNYIDAFIKNIDNKITFFAYLPNKLFSIISTLCFMLLIAILFNSNITETSLLFKEKLLNYLRLYENRNSYTNWYFAICSIVYSVFSWIILITINTVNKKKYNTAGDSFLLFLVISSNLAVILFDFQNQTIFFLQIVSLFFISMLTLKIVFRIIFPIIDNLNLKMENYFVYRYLIPYLEVMRDLGSHAKSTMLSTQAVMSRNTFMSERIKNVIEKTWYVSPQTFLKIIQSDNIKSTINEYDKLGEFIKNAEDWILNIETSNKEKSKWIQVLFDIIENSKNKNKIPKNELGSVFCAIESLAKIASKTDEEFKKDIIDRLSKIVRYELSFDLKIREKSWKVLRSYKLKTVEWPHSSRIDYLLNLMIENPIVIIIVLFVLILIFS